MIAIEFVKVNGRIVPKRFQDRWNAEMLGLPTAGFTYDRSGSALKRLRRAFAGQGFIFSLVKGEQEGPTAADVALVKTSRKAA